MPFSRKANFDLLRSLGFASISANYAKLGNAFTHEARALHIMNQTDGDIFVAITQGSTPASDGTADNLFIPNGSFILWDNATDSSHFTNDPSFVFPKGTQVWVRQSTAPSKLSVYLSILIATGE